MKEIDEYEPPEHEIWHPFWVLEEVQHNMWGVVVNRSEWLEKAIAFTADHVTYGEWMRKVADAWKHSCEHSLTKPGDKRAWIGHAAVAMAIQCPEDIVREAWGYLTDEQRTAANAEARSAIDYWVAKNA
jgi:hypothetical protein